MNSEAALPFTLDSLAIMERHAQAYRALFFDMQANYWAEAKKVNELRAEVERLRARVWKLDKLDDL